MATLKEVAQVAVEARRDKGSGSGRRLREIERILRQHRVLSGLTPEKATSLLEDLGPTFVKMGQIAANRSDVIPPAYADAFKRLRADVPPMPFSTVLATIEESLGHPWRETFSCIEEKPLGSASIAQVHRARIAPHAVGDAGAGTGAAAVPLPADAPKAGSYVAIKVRRPHVVEQMTQDLALIRQAVALVGLTRATDGIKLSLDDLVTELERTTRQELDFCVEQHNLVRFRQFLDDQPGVESPRPYPHLSSDDVLVMDFVEGPMINDVPALRAMGLDPAKLGQRLAESFVTQIVDNGFFHADPHPGNILVRGDDIVWIDLGMVGQLSALERALIGRMFRAVAENDPYALLEALRDGTLDAIATDHAPHSEEDKADFYRAPNGSIGMETALSACYTALVKPGYLTLPELIAKMSLNPARLLKLPGGTLRAGGPADFALFDENRRWTVDRDRLHGRSKNTPFHGMSLSGKVVMTVCRGEIVYQDG